MGREFCLSTVCDLFCSRCVILWWFVVGIKCGLLEDISVRAAKKGELPYTLLASAIGDTQGNSKEY